MDLSPVMPQAAPPPQPTGGNLQAAGPLPQVQPPPQQPPTQLQQAWGQALQEYPRLKEHNFAVQPGAPTAQGGYMEFYPPDESYNPNPGRPTIEVYPKAMHHPALKDMLVGDALHHLGKVDDAYMKLRNDFDAYMDPSVKKEDVSRFKKGDFKDEAGGRSFKDYWDQSRLDAHIRGALFPAANPDWQRKGQYTKEQRQVAEQMRKHLKKQ